MWPGGNDMGSNHIALRSKSMRAAEKWMQRAYDSVWTCDEDYEFSAEELRTIVRKMRKFGPGSPALPLLETCDTLACYLVGCGVSTAFSIAERLERTSVADRRQRLEGRASFLDAMVDSLIDYAIRIARADAVDKSGKFFFAAAFPDKRLPKFMDGLVANITMIRVHQIVASQKEIERAKKAYKLLACNVAGNG
jgi:hypothetical protein